MTDFTPQVDALEQDTPVTGDEEIPSPTEVLAEQGLPADVNEADALDQAYVVELDEEDLPID